MNTSQLFTLNSTDFIKGAVNAVIVAVVVALYGVVSQAGAHFDLFSVDWAAVGKLVVNSALVAFVGDIGRHFVTNEAGDIPTPLGTIPTGKAK